MTEIATPGGPMPVFVAEPDGQPRGAVVVVQEAFGLTTHIEDVTRRLAHEGWLAVAPALFHRQGSPVLDYTDLPAVLPVIGQLTEEGIRQDVGATLAHVESAGFTAEHTGVVGFCMGGSVTLFAATLRPLGAAVTFYGGGVVQGRFGYAPLVELAPHLRTPWLGLYGDLDQSIPPDTVEQLREAAASSPVETEIVRFADADHGFNCNDRPAVYNAAAAAEAWSLTLDWFDRHLA
jgi:carboxymethylenebutenolidase